MCGEERRRRRRRPLHPTQISGRKGSPTHSEKACPTGRRGGEGKKEQDLHVADNTTSIVCLVKSSVGRGGAGEES